MRHLVPLCAPSLLTSLSHGSGSCPLWTLPGLFASDYALPLLHHTYLGGSHVLSYLFLFFTQIGDVDGTEINGSTNICPIFFFKFLSKEDRGLDFQISLHVSDQV